MTPTIGRIVHYTLNDGDADAINRRRADFNTADPGNTGFQAHVGNTAAAGQTYPAMVVRKFDGNDVVVNLQVWLDGSDAYWATSRKEGDEGQHGTWMWPPRV